MKIIHVNLAKTWRGGERQVALLMQGLHEQGIQQVLVCRKGSALEEEAKKNNITCYSFNTLPFLPLFQSRVFRKLEKKGYKIIHCHESRAHTFGILGKIFWSKDQKLILHRRVIFPILKKPTTGIKYSEKYIDKIICISRAVETTVKESIGFQNTIVIPSMINLDSEEIQKYELREKWKIKTRFVIGYIAALTEEKDHITFLRTAKQLLEQHRKDIHFVIIGEGPLKEDLIQFARKSGILKYVTFTGFVKNISGAIQEIDLLLFTSVAEGLGSTILDFFVAGKPVVATKNGGSEELITNGRTGYLCDVGDFETLAERVNFLLENPKKKEEIIKEARSFSRQFGISSVTSKIVEVYKEVL
ncbi:glycosyltransferase [Salegentibacter sp. F188]|uniref:Glycosyltransferase n=1 Tax=Autumnicola patrickiae TaxID=3075591 RepID=A0ABU3DXN8_9FLAO|nr:glycosyltransferase [Salegentibacter sp. F188]MDT0688472.1 glycosyltransferase [Salegentibacter sp. F188]